MLTTLTPARDGSTPCLSLDALCAVRERLIGGIVALYRAVDEAEISGDRVRAEGLNAREAAKLQSMTAALEQVERDIAEWHAISSSLLAA